jgi:hypothetical protein
MVLSFLFIISAVLRARVVYIGSRILFFSIPDPGSASKEFKYLNPEKLLLSSRMIQVVHPGSGFFTHPRSRVQKGTGSRIPDPDPQHWLSEQKKEENIFVS